MEDQLSIFDDIYDIKENITDGQFIILNNKIRSIIQENRRLIQANRKLIQEKKCNCSIKCINSFKDKVPTWFCLESLEKMRNCENFKKLITKVPLLENLFCRIDLPFTEEVCGDSNNQDFNPIINILCSLNEKVSEISSKRNKIIISLVCYDFMIRNAKLIKNNIPNPELLIEIMSKKLKAFSDDQEFLQIALEFNVNLTKWFDIIESKKFLE